MEHQWRSKVCLLLVHFSFTQFDWVAWSPLDFLDSEKSVVAVCIGSEQSNQIISHVNPMQCWHFGSDYWKLPFLELEGQQQ